MEKFKHVFHKLKKWSAQKKIWRWVFAITGGLFFLAMTFVLCVYWGAFGALPDTEELKKINHSLASEVYGSDERLLGRYYIQNRVWADYEDFSPLLLQALLSIEDVRFYVHAGIDWQSWGRVAFKSVLRGEGKYGGGSTLSQQLAKNLYPRKRYLVFGLFINKLKEIFIARRLERLYSKKQILTLYLNTVPFGESTFGIATAARRFFDTTPDALRPEQAATLVGLLKGTTLYNPRLHPENAIKRRNLVLTMMVRQNQLPAQALDSLQALDLGLQYHRYTPNAGLAPYLRAQLLPELKNRLKEIHEAGGPKYNLFTDGLKIYTTLDSRMQTAAENAVNTHMKELQASFDKHWQDGHPWGRDAKVVERAVERSSYYQALKAKKVPFQEIQKVFAQKRPMRLFSWDGPLDTVMSPLDSVVYYLRLLNTGFLALQPQDGAVKAWVGGIEHYYFKYDHVKARRQVGSLFKPFLYAAALKAGREPCDYVTNEQQTYAEADNWNPANADGEYGGEYSLVGGLSKSVNTVAASLIMELGVDSVVSLAKNLGIEAPIPAKPAIALGAVDLSLYDLLPTYASFVNGGRKVSPYFLERIEDRNGRVIYERPEVPLGERALPEPIDRLMCHMLQQVVDSGTARGLRSRYGLKGVWAGKTGTSQGHADGWFVGFNPELVAGVWVGGEDPSVRFRNLSLGQGAHTALPVWGEFMQQLQQQSDFRKLRSTPFEPLPDSLRESLDCPAYREEGDDYEYESNWLEWDDWWRARQARRDSLRANRRNRKELRRQRRDNEVFINKLKRILQKEM